MEKRKIECPFCGYKMPILADNAAEAKGIYVRCKARHCKKEFEIKIKAK